MFPQAIAARAAQLEEEQKELQKINNKVFASFCEDLGISDITEYEGGSLAEVRERQEKLNKLEMLVCADTRKQRGERGGKQPERQGAGGGRG